MLSDLQHLTLTEELFHDTVEHLRKRLAGATESLPADDEDEEFAGDDRRVLHLEMCIYRLCLDAVRSQRLYAEGQSSGSYLTQREHFLRLMAAAAQCELRRDRHILSRGLAAPVLHDPPKTDGEMYDTIRQQAEITLQQLAGV